MQVELKTLLLIRESRNGIYHDYHLHLRVNRYRSGVVASAKSTKYRKFQNYHRGKFQIQFKIKFIY